MSLDPYQQAWKAEASQLKVTFDLEQLSQQVKQSHDGFRATIFWRNVREASWALVMIVVWFAMGIGLSLPWSWWLTVPVLLWTAGCMLFHPKRHAPTQSEPGESLLFYAKESLSQVEHEIWLLRNVFWWYLLPYTASISVFFLHVCHATIDSWWGALLIDVPSGVLLFFLYRWVYRLNQETVREQFKPRQQHLQKIISNLESDGGDASELDDLVEHVTSLSDSSSTECKNADWSAWSENWNRIVPSWWIVAMILAPTLVGAYCGHQFAFADAGPVFFQSVVAAVIPFEIMFFGRCYLTARKFKGQPLENTELARPGYPAIFVIALILVISAFAFAAIYSFVASASSGQSQNIESPDRVIRAPVSDEGYAKVAPFSGVQWEEGLPTVRVDEQWSRLLSVDGIPVEEIMSFTREQFGPVAQKRFAEDLVEVLSKMGHNPDWEVDLELRFSDGKRETVRVRMTKLNRNLVRLDAEIRLLMEKASNN